LDRRSQPFGVSVYGAGSRRVMTKAYGQSKPGVPASTRMHFRSGTVPTAYMSTLLLRRYAKPFQPLGTAAKLRFALDLPQQFPPGTNWSHSHSDYVVLVEVLEKITGRPLDLALRRSVLRPLGLRDTAAARGRKIPAPALHAYSAERRSFLGIAAEKPFVEDASSWNPSWMLAGGAVQTTTIGDLTRTAIAVGTGWLLSPPLAPARGRGEPRLRPRAPRLRALHAAQPGLRVRPGRRAQRRVDHRAVAARRLRHDRLLPAVEADLDRTRRDVPGGRLRPPRQPRPGLDGVARPDRQGAGPAKRAGAAQRPTVALVGEGGRGGHRPRRCTLGVTGGDD
jgi:CubicO group peptidase (beta-lactamase class C family)